jgi:hypothetical protein
VRYLSSHKGSSRASEQAAWELENSSTVTNQNRALNPGMNESNLNYCYYLCKFASNYLTWVSPKSLAFWSSGVAWDLIYHTQQMDLDFI